MRGVCSSQVCTIALTHACCKPKQAMLAGTQRWWVGRCSSDDRSPVTACVPSVHPSPTSDCQHLCSFPREGKTGGAGEPPPPQPLSTTDRWWGHLPLASLCRRGDSEVCSAPSPRAPTPGTSFIKSYFIFSSGASNSTVQYR